VRHGLVKAVLAPVLATACSGQPFLVPATEMTAAEQRGYDAVMAKQPDADVLFIAHQWGDGHCRSSISKTVTCRVWTRVSATTPWVAVTAKLRRQRGGGWLLLGADWSRQ
jgi:hypothetical protein